VHLPPDTVFIGLHLSFSTAGEKSVFFLVAHFLCDKTGDETKRQDENSTSEKRGDQTGFLTLIGPHMSFTSSFGFPVPVTSPL